MLKNQMKGMGKNCEGDVRYSFRDTSQKMRMIYALSVGDSGGNNERHEFLPTITRCGPVSPPTVAVICTAAVTLND